MGRWAVNRRVGKATKERSWLRLRALPTTRATRSRFRDHGVVLLFFDQNTRERKLRSNALGGNAGSGKDGNPVDELARARALADSRHTANIIESCNRLLDELRGRESDAVAYPTQLALTAPLRQRSAEQGDDAFASLWAGQAAPLARPMPAAALVDALVRDARRSLG